jgi:hypothetical protein
MIIRTPLWFKKLTVPLTNKTKEVEAVQLWEVRWTSRHGEYSSDTRPEMEAFTSPEAAHEFADALKNAFKLLRHTSGDTIVVRKAESPKPLLRLVG